MRQACDLLQSLPQKAVDQPAEARRGGMTGGADGIGGHLLQLADDNGGEQRIQPIYSTRLGEIPVLPGVLNLCWRPCIKTTRSGHGPVTLHPPGSGKMSPLSSVNPGA